MRVILQVPNTKSHLCNHQLSYNHQPLVIHVHDIVPFCSHVAAGSPLYYLVSTTTIYFPKVNSQDSRGKTRLPFLTYILLGLVNGPWMSVTRTARSELHFMKISLHCEIIVCVSSLCSLFVLSFNLDPVLV
jgi:hypothetical protein